jgi:hypothetical protein
MLVWTMLVIVGAILCVGWQRFFTLALLAQGAQPPAFEVASIKEDKSDTSVRGGGPQPGRFLRTDVTLRQLIQMAYSRRAFDQREISGGPPGSTPHGSMSKGSSVMRQATWAPCIFRTAKGSPAVRT